jgi:general stress protein 26
MSDMHDPKEMEQRLWKELGRARTVMLGIVGGAPVQHFQPMSAFAEPDTGEIWFFTRKETDLARACQAGADAMMILMTKDQELQACIGGRLTQVYDRERMDRYWGPVVAAWYPEGKDDPALTMLRLDAHDAQIWLSEAGPVKFAYEIAKANATGRMPDIGDRAHVDLGGGLH